MDPLHSHPIPAGSSEAEEVFLAWLEQAERGDGESLATLCEQRPEMAAELRQLALRYDRALSTLAALGVTTGHAALDQGTKTARSEPEPHRHTGVPSRYEIRGEIARGGMGVILEVFDPSLRRTLAMKTLDDRPVDGLAQRLKHERAKSRLLAEAQILGQLDHPGIVPVHEVGLDRAGELYFTMQRVRGRDFSQIIDAVHRRERGEPTDAGRADGRDQPAATADSRAPSAGLEPEEVWTLARAVGVLLRVCEAVGYAHSKGVVHRDLKPSNIMVGRFGETYVMDWGLARTGSGADATSVPLFTSTFHNAPTTRASAATATSLPSLVRTTRSEESDSGTSSALHTLHGDVVGTPAYMPPEQAEGRVAEVGERADVYALGAMLYHLLAGERPYAHAAAESSAEETLADVLRGPPERVRALAPDAPDELIAISEKAMSRRPELRYSNMTALAEDLRAYLEGRVVRAHRTGLYPELVKWTQRNKLAAAGLASAGLAVIAIAIVQTVSKRDVSLARRVAEARSESLRREGYVNQVALAYAARESEDVALAKELLAACPADLRGWEWRHLSREIDTSDRSISDFERGYGQVAWSRDGHRIAAAQSDDRADGWKNGVVLWDAFNLETVRFQELKGVAGCPVFSSDGTRLAVATLDLKVKLWEAETGIERLSLPVQHNATSCALSPDGTRLAAALDNGELLVWDIPSGKLLRKISGHVSAASALTFSADGKQLFSAGWDHTVRAWDPERGTELCKFTLHKDRVWALAASPDGRFLASGGWDLETLVYDPRSFELLHRLPRGKGMVKALAWSPDSRYLATVNGPVLRIYETESFRERECLVGHDVSISGAAFSPDGNWIATSAPDALRLWDISCGTRERCHHLGQDTIWGLAFDPQGSRLACKVDSGNLEIWDALTQRRLSRVGGEPDSAGEALVRWSPDGRQVAVGRRTRNARLYDTHGWELACTLGASGLNDLNFSPDGRSLSITEMSGNVRVWDTSTGERLWSKRAYEGALIWPFGAFGGAFSPDGKLVATGARDNCVKLWNAATGELVRVLRGAGETYLESVFSPDGKQLVACVLGPSALEAFDVESGETVWFVQHVAQRRPCFSPDGSRLYSGNEDGSLGVWDPATGRRLLTLQGHDSNIFALAVSPDGERVATGGIGTLAIYDTRPWR